MLAFVRLLVAGWLCVVLAGTAPGKPSEVDGVPTPSPDPLLAELISMGEQVVQVAQRAGSDGVLRQIDTDLDRIVFHFTDRPATQVTQVVVPAWGAPPDEWQVESEQLSPLMSHPGAALELEGLRVGPAEAAQAMVGHWPGCAIRTLTLYGEKEDLTWVVFCQTDEGFVSGRIDNRTALLEPSPAPPVLPPVTAPP